MIQPFRFQRDPALDQPKVAAMPRGRVNHAIGALETLAEESAKQSEAELRTKVGEESTLVVCKYSILTFY